MIDSYHCEVDVNETSVLTADYFIFPVNGKRHIVTSDTEGNQNNILILYVEE